MSRKFKLLVKDSGETTIETLKYFDANIEMINSMDVFINIVKIDESDCDKETVEELKSNGITRLPALITDMKKVHVGFQKIKELFGKNFKTYRQRGIANPSMGGGGTDGEFGTNPELGDFYRKGLLDDKAQDNDESTTLSRDLDKKRRDYKPPKHRVATNAPRGFPREQGQERKTDAPPQQRTGNKQNTDPDDNIEIGDIGSSVLESLEKTDNEDRSPEDDVMERAMWQGKSGNDD